MKPRNNIWCNWIEYIEGCTDELACNYNSNASVDDGSCSFYENLRGDCAEDNSTCEVVTDIDGNDYGTVQIGNQVWMKQNLKVETYNNGDEIQYVYEDSHTDGIWENLTIGAQTEYGGISANIEVYGKIRAIGMLWMMREEFVLRVGMSQVMMILLI